MPTKISIAIPIPIAIRISTRVWVGRSTRLLLCSHSRPEAVNGYLGIDRSPAATFIESNYCTPCDVYELQNRFDEVLRATEREVGWVYATRSGDGDEGEIVFQLWSQKFQCPRCLSPTALFEAPRASVATGKGRTVEKPVCPRCLERDVHERLDAHPVRVGLIPVATSYECKYTRPKRRFRTRLDASKLEAEAFSEVDLQLIQEVNATRIDYPYPTGRTLNCQEPEWGYLWRPYLDGIERVCDFFTHRNNLVLATFTHYARTLGGDHSSRLVFLASSIIWHASKMSQFKKGGGGIMPGLYYVPPVHKEQNVLRLLKRKFRDFTKAYEQIDPVTNRLCLSTQSATDMAAIPSNSIDYIFTDPPYADNVQYGEANHLWEAWLGLDTNWRDEEIVINRAYGHDERHWEKLMKAAMLECFRILKPGRWLTLCYHDSSEGTWELIQDIMVEGGFVTAPAESTLYIDARQKSPKQLTTAKTTKRDLVINFRKPKFGEWLVTKLFIPADADHPTFSELGSQIIAEFLTAHPGATKDRIYDALVSRMVSEGQMETHDFDQLLGRTAEEAHGRWYLKETADVIDHAEQQKEDDAAEHLEQSMLKYLRGRPEEEGVHYSDIFEGYLPILDKPRRLLLDWLPDYFYFTSSGTWRPPKDDEERQQKAALRVKGTLRRVKRFANALIDGVPVRDKDRPASDADLADWIQQCRREGLYEQGRALYEKGGLNLDKLDEVEQLEVEDAYRICVRRGTEAEEKPKRKGRKKS